MKANQEAERRVDAELLMRVAQGDEAAFSQLYDRFSPGLYSLVLQITHDEMQAQDALQEGFTQIWRKAHTYDPVRSSAFTWAVMICRNKTIDHLRVRQRIARTLEKATLEMTAGDDMDQASASFPDLREQRLLVRRAVQSLPEDQREALELSFFGGLTHEEIATRLTTPLGTIKARIRRGLLRLRESLKRTL